MVKRAAGRAVKKKRETSRKTAERFQKIKKRMLRPIKKRRKRAIEQRGVLYENLPEEIQKIVDEIKNARLRRLRGVSSVSMGTAFNIVEIMKKQGVRSPRHIAFGMVVGAMGTLDYLLSESILRRRNKKLEDIVINSTDPRIQFLRIKYPFFLVDFDGNLIFTTRKRFLKIFGRLRGKTPIGGKRRKPEISEELRELLGQTPLSKKVRKRVSKK